MPSKCVAFSACLFGASFLGACESLDLDPPPLAQIQADADAVVDDRQVVVLVRTSEEAFQLLERSGVRSYTLERRETFDALGLILLVLALPPELTGEAAIRELESLAPGVTAGLNHGYRDQPIAQSAAGRLYADNMLRWPPGCCRSDVPIGVIDAAIASADGDFLGAALPVRDCTGGQTAEASHAVVTAQVIAGPGRLSGVRLYNAAVVGRHRLNEAAASVDAMSSALNWLVRSRVR